MENKIKLTIGMMITLALAISGTYYVADGDEAYYCESRNIVMLCEKLSKANSEGIQSRCYFSETYKTCKEGWEKIIVDQEIDTQVPGNPIPEPLPPSVDGTKWSCSSESCVRIS